jgi:hypothetical protein
MSLYQSSRDAIQTGDLIEFRSDSLIGRAIRAVTRREVNHTALVIRPDDLFGIEDRVVLLEALEGGVAPNYLSQRLDRHRGQAYWLPVRIAGPETRRRIGRIAVDTFLFRKPRYDYRSLFFQLAFRVSLDAGRYFCSEWCQWVLTQADVLEYRDTAMRPGEFFDTGMFYNPVQIL